MLSDMVNLGISVPPGFTITTDACLEYFSSGNVLREEIWSQVIHALKDLEVQLGLGFGNKDRPLLISVRSGARVSMPGMMDTILNLGLNDLTVLGLIQNTSDDKFAYDSYRRFIEMYGNVVLGIKSHLFEEIFVQAGSADHDITAESLKDVVIKYQKLVLEKTKRAFPQDPQEQLKSAITKVFESWYSERAKTYRAIHDIPGTWGTAVNVQSMVFGNMGQDSGTGVAFTRNPVTGAQELFGEFLLDAQGEDIVAGIRTPRQMTILGKCQNQSQDSAMEEVMPLVFGEFISIAAKLEEYYCDMQDIEFTIQQGKLWILQSRNGKRTAQAAVKIAVDLALEGKISKHEAIKQIKPEHIEKLLHHTIDPKEKTNAFTKGLPASPGAASGIICFSSSEAEIASKHAKVILVRHETSPEDIGGMNVAEGILTVRGGMTSHAAVVARGMGKPCICGASQAIIDYDKGVIAANGVTLKAGDKITINGTTGEVFIGEVPMIMPELIPEFDQIMAWASDIARLRVRANAETVADAEIALKFGAEGIGLCRTEHMFFHPNRLVLVRKMILALSLKERLEALAQLLPFQTEDFKGIFLTMRDKPVTIRLLDPPLHEFLPTSESEIESFAKNVGHTAKEIKMRINHMSEINPMLGHRGCRLAITFPEIYEMQVKAIFSAVIELKKQNDLDITPEIMIPLIFDVRELSVIKERIVQIIEDLSNDAGMALPYLFGVMIELPRAALQAGAIAKLVDFCSFGTNDLTQTTFGLSRDDASKFLGAYHDIGILTHDPFISLDQSGVGELISIAVERSRAANPNIKIGICGEHGADPRSIEFFDKMGLDYVSCSPYRLPMARLASAAV